MKWILSLSVGFLLMGIVTQPITAQEEKKEEPKKEEVKPDEGLPPLPERPKTLEEAVKKADLIFVGIVDFIGDKPGGWGTPPYRPATQYIRYEVVKFLKGQRPEKKIAVYHELFKGSKTAGEQPGLNPNIIDIDKKVILLLPNDPVETNPVAFLSQDPDFGVMAWTEENEKTIQELIRK